MIKCIIVDDEPLARSLIEGHVLEVPYLECLGTFKNAVLAANFLANNAVDLIFLDIQMPKLTGIDFLKSLKNPPKVIFTTAYREYAVESYELQVLDYLLKPITFTRFFQAISKLNISSNEVSTEENKTSDHIFVQANKKHLKVVLNDILYVESHRDYLKIHLETRSILIKERISNFIKLLPEHQFAQVHRSYIVALDKITAFTQQDIEIGKIEIPIGGIFKEQLISRLNA
ncbi:LytR/AlgR family response regulator transcription factor [Spongiimicrobium salis]|uniref:LytR/AlgR family response regulator transcription factor n=1 Tax=Spongiimicrobium salis TaxID=1667022 RepID=UPI00374D8821